MRGIALVLALLLAVPSAAWAADASPQARAKAKAHIKKARAFYDQEQYDQAVAEYDAAYKIVGVSDILFNIGQILRTKGDKPAAVKAYRRYLSVEPAGAHADESRDYVQQLTRDQVPATSRDKWDFVEAQKKPVALEERWQKLNERVGNGELDGLDDELKAMEKELNPSHAVVIDDAATRRAAATVVKSEPRKPHEWPPYTRKWWFWTAIGGGAAVVLAVALGAALGGPKDPSPSLGVLK